MCASYGLGGGTYSAELLDFDPFTDKAELARLNEWIGERGGKAAITGRKALNLNPIIRDVDGQRALEFAWWWLWLDGSGPVKFSAFNSRDDKLLRSWRKPFQHRALLPADWYVEKGQRFGLPGGEAFGIAAITSTVVDEATGTERITYSMVTRDAIGEATTVHPRMPLVLPRDLHDDWLDPDRPGDQNLLDHVRLASDEISAEMTTRGERPAPAVEPALF